MEQGDKKAADIIRTCLMSRTEIPEKYLEDSGLYEWLLPEFRAFYELSTDRLIEGGPIPWSSMARYADRFGYNDPADFERFCFLIRELDVAWSEWHSEEQKKERDKRDRANKKKQGANQAPQPRRSRVPIGHSSV